VDNDFFALTQAGAGCERINYDPLVMADGIAATNNPSFCSVRHLTLCRSQSDCKRK